MRPNLNTKAQSAMEYLMTYGWAILVILVVLGILYLLHVFSPNSVIGNQCIVNFGYLCQTPVMSTSGELSVLIGQNTGQNYYNIALACTASTNSTSGGPFTNGTSPWYYVNSTGSLKTSYNSSSTYTLSSGVKLNVNNLPCFGTTGTLLMPVSSHALHVVYSFSGYNTSTTTTTSTTTSTNTTSTVKSGAVLPLNTQFSGNLWIRYTKDQGTPGSAGNPWNAKQIAYVTVSVTSS
ncbi:MAG: hypothetical protein LVQ95_05335 [Candidatus Micrarchaeales archaeon]|nr:hypothetical protein [Candidatus Micrarchaeales archaeon]